MTFVFWCHCFNRESRTKGVSQFSLLPGVAHETETGNAEGQDARSTGRTGIYKNCEQAIYDYMRNITIGKQYYETNVAKNNVFKFATRSSGCHLPVLAGGRSGPWRALLMRMGGVFAPVTGMKWLCSR